MKERLLEMLENNQYFSHDYKVTLKEIMPVFKKCSGFMQDNPYHCYDVYMHTLVAVENCDGDMICRLACLFHDIGKPDCLVRKDGVDHFYDHPKVSAEITEPILKEIGFSEGIVEEVCGLIRIHDIPMSPKNVLKHIRKYGRKQIERLIQLRIADIMAQSTKYRDWRLESIYEYEKIFYSISEDDIEIDKIELDINGNKIKQVMNLEEGIELGFLIRDMKTRVYYHEIPNEHTALVYYLIGRRDEREGSK